MMTRPAREFVHFFGFHDECFCSPIHQLFVTEERVIAYLLGVGGRGLVGGGPGHGGIPADEGAGPLKLYPKELNEVGSLGFNNVCAGAGIAKACIYVVQ